jgi:hypothetical protein
LKKDGKAVRMKKVRVQKIQGVEYPPIPILYCSGEHAIALLLILRVELADLDSESSTHTSAGRLGI